MSKKVKPKLSAIETTSSLDASRRSFFKQANKIQFLCYSLFSLFSDS